MLKTAEIMKNACKSKVVIPAFNVPYLPMVEPVVKAVVDQDAFALVATARPEWFKFEAKGPVEVFQEFMKWENPAYVRIHLDHVPVIDEDGERVDYVATIRKALETGYPSVMVDASRLDLEGNIASTYEITELAHSFGAACEAELGAVMGHEAGPLPPYEEIFASGKGFTDVDECIRFVKESHCDWLSVAVGSIHGAISGAAKDAKKVEARLNIAHLKKLKEAAGNIPLVLHGGSGVKREYVLEGIQNGICKINIGAEIRQAYEQALRSTNDVSAAQQAVYERTVWVIKDYFEISGKRRLVNP